MSDWCESPREKGSSRRRLQCIPFGRDWNGRLQQRDNSLCCPACKEIAILASVAAGPLLDGLMGVKGMVSLVHGWLEDRRCFHTEVEAQKLDGSGKVVLQWQRRLYEFYLLAILQMRFKVVSHFSK